MKIKNQELTVCLLFLYAVSCIASITIGEIFFIAALISWVYGAVARKSGFGGFFTSPLAFPMGVFALLHLVSAVFGVDAINGIKDFRKIYLLLMFFLAMNAIASEEGIKKCAGLFSAGSGLIGLYAITNTVIHRYLNHEQNFRASSFSGTYMMAGGMLMMGVIVTAGILAYLFINERKKMGLIAIFSAMFVLAAGGLIFTFTRGSWIAAFAGIVIIAAVADKRIVAVFIIALFAAGFLARDTDVAKRVLNTFQMKGRTSEMERVHMWKAGLNIIKDHPVIGIGTGNLEKVYPKYRMPEAVESNAGHLHNNLIQVAVIDGLPGLAAYLWIFAAFWISLYKAFQKEDNKLLKSAIITGFSVNIAFFLNGFFEYNLFSSQVALIFWFLMGITYAAIRMKRVEKAEKPEKAV